MQYYYYNNTLSSPFVLIVLHSGLGLSVLTAASLWRVLIRGRLFFFFLFFFWDTYRQRPFVSVKANFHKNWALSLPTSNAGGRSGLFFLPVPTIYFLQQLLAKGMDLKKFLHGADSMHSEILCHFKLQGLAMISFRLSVRTFVCV